MVQTSSGRTGSFRGTRAAVVGISAVLASAAILASPPRTVGKPVYGSPRSPRVSAGPLAGDTRPVAGSQPTRAAALANADRRPFAADTGMSPHWKGEHPRHARGAPSLCSAPEYAVFNWCGYLLKRRRYFIMLSGSRQPITKEVMLPLLPSPPHRPYRLMFQVLMPHEARTPALPFCFEPHILLFSCL